MASSDGLGSAMPEPNWFTRGIGAFGVGIDGWKLGEFAAVIVSRRAAGYHLIRQYARLAVGEVSEIEPVRIRAVAEAGREASESITPASNTRC